jgi:hypothetical protein
MHPAFFNVENLHPIWLYGDMVPENEAAYNNAIDDWPIVQVKDDSNPP